MLSSWEGSGAGLSAAVETRPHATLEVCLGEPLAGVLIELRRNVRKWGCRPPHVRPQVLTQAQAGSRGMSA